MKRKPENPSAKPSSVVAKIKYLYWRASKVQQAQIRHWFREAEAHQP